MTITLFKEMGVILLVQLRVTTLALKQVLQYVMLFVGMGHKFQTKLAMTIIQYQMTDVAQYAY